MAIFYVATNGSDSNAGTVDKPWLTMYKAAATLVAGDTVYVKAGTYDASTCPAYFIPSINPANSGTPGNPIAFRVFPGDTVLLDNKNMPSCPAIGSRLQSYITIDGFTIINSGDQGIGLWGTLGARLQGIIVENTTVSGMRKLGNTGDNTPGIYLTETSGTIIRNNRISNIDNGGTHNATGILMYHNDNVLIEHNEIFTTNSGIFLKDDVSSTTVRYNFVHDCPTFGIGVFSHNGDTLRDNTVYGNIITRCALQGITVTGSSVSPTLNTIVQNNTVTNSPQAIDANVGATNTKVWNDIIYGASVSGNLDPSNPSITFVDYNVYYLSPVEGGANSLTSNPLFIDTAFAKTTDFKLQISSPDRGTGLNGVDRGAYVTGTTVIGISSVATPATPVGIIALGATGSGVRYFHSRRSL